MSGELLAQVQLSRGEAEALAEQLAAVALGAPPTPPTARVPEETLVGLVYDKCMELHVGPESAPIALPPAGLTCTAGWHVLVMLQGTVCPMTRCALAHCPQLNDM